MHKNHGYWTGDEILKMIGSVLSSSSRAHDSVGRRGGEEFLVVLAHMNEGLLKEITDRHRALINSSCVSIDGKRIRATASAGATLFKEGDDFDSIIARADELIYRSKTTGKNKVTIG